MILKESLKCHHNEITKYILDNFIQNKEEVITDVFKTCLFYYNFEYIQKDNINSSSLFYLCKYNHFALLDLFLKSTNFDVNKIIEVKSKYKDVRKEKTGFNIAVKKGNFDTVKLLLSYENLDINRPDKEESQCYSGIKNGLFYSVEMENIEMIKILLEREDCDINFINRSNRDDGIDYQETALGKAFQKRNLQIIKLLLDDKRINPNVRFYVFYQYCIVEYSTIYDSVKNQNTNIIKHLLKLPNFNPNFSMICNYTDDHGFIYSNEEIRPLNLAIYNQNIEIIKLLLSSSNIDVNAPNVSQDQKKTALMQAIETKNIEIIELLLSVDKIDMNAINKIQNDSVFEKIYNDFYRNQNLWNHEVLWEDMTAFHAAIKTNISTIVKLFLQHDKVDINCQYKSLGYINYPLEISAYLNYWLIKEKTALIMAVEQENIEIIQLLLAYGKIHINDPLLIKEGTSDGSMNYNYGFQPIKEIQFDSCYLEKKSALFLAIEKGNIDITKLLLKHNDIDLNFINKTYNYSERLPGWDKTTALNLAVENGCTKIVELLLEYEKIDVNFRNQKEGNKERTALHTAVEKGKIDIIKLLLIHENVEIEAKDEQGKTPSEYTNDQQILELFKLK